MPRTGGLNTRAKASRLSIVMVVFAVFMIVIFVTASYGLTTIVGNLIPFWALLLIISLLGVSVMVGAAFTAAKSHLH